MILQELYRYYERKAHLGEVTPDGAIKKEIDFLIVLDDASGARIEDLRQPSGKKLIGKAYTVPSIGKQSQKKDNSGTDANLLWDNSAFIFGLDKNGNAAKAQKRRDAFISTIERYYPEPPDDVKAVLDLLKDGRRFEELKANALADPKIADGSAIVSFRVGMDLPIFEMPHVGAAVDRARQEDAGSAQRGVCLVTGERDVQIALTHTVVKKIPGGQGAGCNMVSFNAPSFCSYGMKQGENSQVSVTAADRYVKAIQMLVDSIDNRTYIADATVLAWAERPEEEASAELEAGWSAVFGDAPSDAPDAGVLKIKGLLKSIESGKFSRASGRFFVLGLSPNASRLAVRCWEAGPVKIFAERIARHFERIEIVRGEKDPEYLSLNRMLRATALENKISNVAPNMAGCVMRSILAGTPYPQSFFTAALRRIRADRIVSRTRCAILKAYLCSLQDEKEMVSVSLDERETNIGYLLGRLFAVLEKVQTDALGDLNAGIRDRYYGAASSTPVTVFPRLIKMSAHHLSAMNAGSKVYHEKKIGAIMDGITAFPSLLSMRDQGRFAIGYYHQRQDMFRSSKNTGGDCND